MPSFEAEVRAPRAKKAFLADFIVTNEEAEARRIFSSILGVPEDHIRLIPSAPTKRTRRN